MPALASRPVRLALVALLALAHPLGAQASPQPAAADTVIPGAALREDVRVLRAALSAVHPGLHRYVTPRALDARLAALEARLARGATRREAWLAIAEVTGTIRCGHTFPNPANQSRAVADAVFRRTPRVPFYFRWLGRRMIVTRDASAAGLFAPGTEILAIDGVPAATILERLLPYSRTDGGNDAKRVANLALNPVERWQAFDVFFPLVFPSRPGAWRFRIRTPAGAERTVSAPPVDAAQRMAVYDSAMRAGRDTTGPPWTLQVADDGVAVMTMPTWVTYNDRWDWESWVDSAFAGLAGRGARALVIDLRGNEGGTGVGDRILAHLVERPVALAQLREFVRYRQLPDTLRRHLDTWDRSFDDWSAVTSPAPERPGFLRLVRAPADTAGTAVRPIGARWTGPVFVLVGADNSSATFEFALAMRELRLGTLVGQPTGGNRRGINGGAFYFLRLPNSRIEVDLPIIGFYPDRAQPDAGLVPDIAVTVTAADIAAGRDPELQAVRRALKAR